LPAVVAAYAGDPDVFMSQNKFWARRCVAFHAAWGVFYVDLDYQRTPWATRPPGAVLDAALVPLVDHRLPLPSFALASGRGRHLVRLHEPVPQAALPHATHPGPDPGPRVQRALGAAQQPANRRRRAPHGFTPETLWKARLSDL
jgi:hypothetical protein